MLFRSWLPRDARAVELNELTLLSFDAEQNSLKIRVSGGGGTYVRAIARDLGTILGVPVALTELRRTEAGKYSVEQAVTLEELHQRWGEFQQKNGIDSDEVTG